MFGALISQQLTNITPESTDEEILTALNAIKKAIGKAPVKLSNLLINNGIEDERVINKAREIE